MTITIDVHTAEYAPWEEGADERERISERSESITFDTARECADWLEREGLQQPSVYPGPYSRHTWLGDLDPCEHPHTGVLTEKSAHLAADPNVSARLWAAIVASVSRKWTYYKGPYYVEFEATPSGLIWSARVVEGGRTDAESSESVPTVRPHVA